MSKDNQKEDILEECYRLGIEYVNKQKRCLKINTIFSLYTLIMTLIMFISFIQSILIFPLNFAVRILFSINTITTFLLLTFGSVKQIQFLKKWSKLFDDFKKGVQNDNKEVKKVTLTDIFYNQIEFISKFKYFFILVNILFISYFILFPQIFFGLRSWDPRGPPPPNINLAPPLTVIFQQFFDFINFIVVFLYLIYLWYRFLTWNKKKKKVRNYEKDIFKEIMSENDNI